MPDPRFYEPSAGLTLSAVARLAGAQVPSADDGLRVRRVAPLRRADADDLAFFADSRYADDLATTRAGAVLVSPRDAARAPSGCTRLITDEPLAAYARVAARLHPPRQLGTAEAGLIDRDALVETGARLGPGVVLGAGAHIGAGTVIGANTVVGPGVAIGRDGAIGANVTLGFCLIGDRVRILAGAVVGEAGFGVASTRLGPIDVPQLGRVIIQDGVTIGANTCIDRGAWDDTVIGENTKIDNLVHVAHNVVVGRNCRMAAFTGLSGSVTVGDEVMFGGRAGVLDHVDIASRVRLAASCAVTKDVPEGEVWGGTPARPVGRWLREAAWLARQSRARPRL